MEFSEVKSAKIATNIFIEQTEIPSIKIKKIDFQPDKEREKRMLE